MKKATLKLTALFMLMGGAYSSSAQTGASNNLNVVTTAVPFLRISPDARSAAMGDVGIATSADAYSGFWNNAKTPFADKKLSVGVTYTPWLTDLKLNDVYLLNVGGYYKLDDEQAVNAGLRYFSLGDIQFTDAAGQTLNNFRPREFALDAGYSRKLSSKMGLGVNLHYISSDLAGGTVNGVSYRKGTTVAGDIHYYYKGTNASGNGFDFGATLSNLGGKISYTSDASQKDFIPANLGLGAAYNKKFDEDSKITFALDINKLMVPTPPTDTAASSLASYRSKGVVSSWFSSLADGEDFKELTIAFGAEYWYKNQFALRGGYFYENPSKGARKYFTLGAGLKYSTFGLNFSYLLPSGAGINRNPLSNTLRFSLMFDMDK